MKTEHLKTYLEKRIKQLEDSQSLFMSLGRYSTEEARIERLKLFTLKNKLYAITSNIDDRVHERLQF